MATAGWGRSMPPEPRGQAVAPCEYCSGRAERPSEDDLFDCSEACGRQPVRSPSGLGRPRAVDWTAAVVPGRIAVADHARLHGKGAREWPRRC